MAERCKYAYRKYTVYLLVCTANGKKYVGVTSRKPDKRWRNGKGYSHQPIYEDIERYGWDAFDKIILNETEDEQLAYQLEKMYIEEFHTFDSDEGYNQTTGGELIGKYKTSKSFRRKLSEGKQGKNNPNFGKTGTMLGKKLGAESRKLLSEKRKKLFESKQFREANAKQLSEARKHYHPTQEQINYCTQRMKEKVSKPCICLETGERYSSAREAAELNNLSFSTVARLCRTNESTKRTGKKLSFRYI